MKRLPQTSYGGVPQGAEPQPARASGPGYRCTGRACLVQGDAARVIVLSPTGLALLGPHDASHAALLLQVGHAAVLLGCPATEGSLSSAQALDPILPVTLPGGMTGPISQRIK